MEEYAAQDPVTTQALWDLLESKTIAYASARLEHDTATIIALQERFGFLFDIEGAARLEIELRGRKAELEDRLREPFRPCSDDRTSVVWGKSGSVGVDLA